MSRMIPKKVERNKIQRGSYIITFIKRETGWIKEDYIIDLR
jgi:hypothetical protein